MTTGAGPRPADRGRVAGTAERPDCRRPTATLGSGPLTPPQASGPRSTGPGDVVLAGLPVRDGPRASAELHSCRLDRCLPRTFVVIAELLECGSHIADVAGEDALHDRAQIGLHRLVLGGDLVDVGRPGDRRRAEVG